MNIRPSGNNILVKPDPSITMENGIHIPERSPNTGLVISVSPDMDSPVEVGDRIQYTPKAGHAIEFNDQVFLIMNIDLVILKFND